MNDTFLPGSGFDTYESQDKVLMQMDGSTEAAVAVRILQQQGFAVVGAVVRLAPEQAEAAQRAKKAAEALGIECILLNAEALAQQPGAAGAWPQFAALLTAADKLGIQYVASGWRWAPTACTPCCPRWTLPAMPAPHWLPCRRRRWPVCCCLWANSTPEIWLSWRRSSSCKTTFFIVPRSGTQKRHRFCGAFCCG